MRWPNESFSLFIVRCNWSDFWLPSIIVSPPTFSVSIGVLINVAHNENETKKNNKLLCTPGPCIILQCSILHFACQLTFRLISRLPNTLSLTFSERLTLSRRKYCRTSFWLTWFQLRISSSCTRKRKFHLIWRPNFIINVKRNKPSEKRNECQFLSVSYLCAVLRNVRNVKCVIIRICERIRKYSLFPSSFISFSSFVSFHLPLKSAEQSFHILTHSMLQQWIVNTDEGKEKKRS